MGQGDLDLGSDDSGNAEGGNVLGAGGGARS